MRPLAFALLLLLAGCGDLPMPFLGNPGATARRLAEPPPSRLSIPAPSDSLLPDQGGGVWAESMADALREQEVPAVSAERRRGDWSLAMSAELKGDSVVPTYTVLNPAGQSQGSAQGAPIPVRDWANADPAMLKQSAAQGAPGISALLNRIEAARRQSDPNSLLNRPARVYLAGVTGAPGDGNRSLPTQMRVRLGDGGVVIQDTAEGADFTLKGEVATAPGAGGTMRIELQWIVTDAKGEERGRILQLNEVPRGSLDAYWGDVAVVVAQEAAGGVRDVLTNATGRREQAKAAKPG